MDKNKMAVGVSVHVIKAGRVLLGRRNKALSAGGLLSTPGGRVEENESVLHAAVREVDEETGLHVHDVDMEVFAVREKFAYGAHFIMFYVRVKACSSCGDEPRTMEPNKCDGWQWFDPQCIEPVETTEPEDILLAGVWEHRDELAFFGTIDERKDS